MKITEEDYYIHAEEWGNGYALLIEDGEGSIQKMEDLKLQIISNQKKADKYDDYHKDNWIAIPRADFDVMRKELKEEEQENKRLKEKLKAISEYYSAMATEGIDEQQYNALFELIGDSLATKEGKCSS